MPIVAGPPYPIVVGFGCRLRDAGEVVKGRGESRGSGMESAMSSSAWSRGYPSIDLASNASSLHSILERWRGIWDGMSSYHCYQFKYTYHRNIVVRNSYHISYIVYYIVFLCIVPHPYSSNTIALTAKTKLLLQSWIVPMPRKQAQWL